MATIKRLKDRRSDLAVFEISGPVTRNEVSHLLDASMTTDSTLHLFDFRWASLKSLSKADIKSQIKTLKNLARPGAKTAFVFSNPTDFSIGRLISKRTTKEGFPSETRGFYNPYLARDWLLFRHAMPSPAI